MDHLPVEVIGNILSLLGSARDVVVASATCKKWREAWRSHLHSLSFNYCDWPLYHEYTSPRLEILITQTIFQTKALQFLTIFMDDDHEFSAAPVIAWLMYTRDSLRQLHYNVRTNPSFNIIEKCSRHRLEVLALARNSIVGVEPGYLKFPCLKSLSLSFVSISALDLSLLLSSCPKLETLAMVSPEIAISDSQASVELISVSLKNFHLELFSSDKFILDVDLLETLHLKDCTFEIFELVGKGTLKALKIDDVSVIHLDIGDGTENLEIIDVCNFTIMWPKFYHVISKASKLYKLRLWGVVFDDEDEGLSCLKNVVVLELGWTVISDLFSVWVAGLLEGCPNLKKLVVYGYVSEVKTHEECQILARFSEFILQLGRKYGQVKFEFEYE
ncbi:hypothetical protein PHAVU_001G189500 [Phaseolus vulgaris]